MLAHAVACSEGENHLLRLAQVNERVTELANEVAGQPEPASMLMAALLLADDLEQIRKPRRGRRDRRYGGAAGEGGGARARPRELEAKSDRLCQTARSSASNRSPPGWPPA